MWTIMHALLIVFNIELNPVQHGHENALDTIRACNETMHISFIWAKMRTTMLARRIHAGLLTCSKFTPNRCLEIPI